MYPETYWLMSGSPPHMYQLTVWPFAAARVCCHVLDAAAAAAASSAELAPGVGAPDGGADATADAGTVALAAAVGGTCVAPLEQADAISARPTRRAPR
jgi:hypothetical protein